MRTADFSSALIWGGLRRRFGAVLFGIGAIREKAQRSLVQPRRDKICSRPYLPIANDGAVECRLLGPAAVVDPGSDAAGWWFVLDAASDFRIVKALQDALQRRRVSKVGMGRAYHCSVLAPLMIGQHGRAVLGRCSVC
jgi:hypothetical protein